MYTIQPNTPLSNSTPPRIISVALDSGIKLTFKNKGGLTYFCLKSSSVKLA